MQPGSCEGAPQLDIVSAFQSYGRFLEEGSTEAAEKTRYDTVRNSCRKEGGSCGGESTSDIFVSQGLTRLATIRNVHRQVGRPVVILYTMTDLV
jgi:hypothetical protein